MKIVNGRLRPTTAEKMYLTNDEYKSKIKILKTGEQFTIEKMR